MASTNAKLSETEFPSKNASVSCLKFVYVILKNCERNILLFHSPR